MTRDGSAQEEGRPGGLTWPSARRPMLSTGRSAILGFVVAYAALALTMCFLVAPFEGMDEGAHYFRAVSITGGGLLPIQSPTPEPRGLTSRGGMVDANAARVERALGFGTGIDIPHMTAKALKEGIAVPPAGRRVYVVHSNTVIYNPVMYAPQAAAILVARWLGAGPLAWLYAGRCAGALAFCLLLWLALSTCREIAAPLAFVAVLPIPFFQVGTLTCDTLLLGAALLYAACLARLLRREPASGGFFVLLLLATLIVATGKVAYLGLAAAVPVFGLLHGNRRVIAATAAIAGIAFAVFIAWTLMIRHDVIPVRYDILTDPALQLRWMMRHPGAAMRAITVSAITDFPVMLVRMVGDQIGHNDVKLPLKATVPLLLVLGWLVARRLAVRRNAAASGILALMFVGSYLAINVMLYMQWTVVGAPRVDGVQGRYLWPLVIPFLALPLVRRVQAGAALPAPTIPLALVALVALLPLWEVWRVYWLA